MVDYRLGHWRYRLRPRLLRVPCSVLHNIMKISVQVTTGIDLPCEVTLERRLRIDHFEGVIVSGDTIIGEDVVICATDGSRSESRVDARQRLRDKRE